MEKITKLCTRMTTDKYGKNNAIRKSSMNINICEWKFNEEQNIYIVSNRTWKNELNNYKEEKQLSDRGETWQMPP